MRLNNFYLFIIPTFIWGSTWYAIKFQLGTVNPLLSVGYRFAISGIILLVICRILKFNLKYSLKSHFFILLQGICLFGINYWLVYFAELSLTSGLVAVVFSLIIFLNTLFNSLILKARIRKEVIVGGTLGILGTIIMFKNEFMTFSLNNNGYGPLLLCFASVWLASLGNIISAYNQRKGLPVVETNALGMTYGSIFTLLTAVISGAELNFDLSFSYIISLFYLVLFGSIIAFSTYLKLLGNIGPDRSSYAILLIPVIAMIISTIFESYNWHKSAIIGIVLLLAGNLLVMNKSFITKRKIL
jgi:drug/metabolite transporter (DMT)-like permease